MFVTSSKDGDIKVWDGVSNKCVNTFAKAHDGNEVCSVEFSRNSKVSVKVKQTKVSVDLKKVSVDLKVKEIPRSV